MAVIDISKYAEMNEKFGDCMYRVWGPTLIGFPSDTDSSRALMATSQQKQFLTLLHPDVPHVLTGFENAFGKYNRSYLALKGTWESLIRSTSLVMGVSIRSSSLIRKPRPTI